jgi:hypothetical protein
MTGISRRRLLLAADAAGGNEVHRTADDITTTRVRLRITQSAACPALSEFGLFLEAT